MCFININNIIIIAIIIRYSVFIVFLCGISWKIWGTLSKDEDDGSENEGKNIKYLYSKHFKIYSRNPSSSLPENKNILFFPIPWFTK